mmetsp:Transcript_84811/g.134286  ORF Transcript_84811/g.134286 Transcript_84811/m.134286 type:complete len:330 (+) Transcript_84811:62-1051(+)
MWRLRAAFLLILSCKFVGLVHCGRITQSFTPSSLAADAVSAAEAAEDQGICSRSMYILGCGPSPVCETKNFQCKLKSDTDLADGATKVTSRVLAKAEGFNSSTWATRGLIEFTKLNAAFKELNVYSKVLLDPGYRPEFRRAMQASKPNLKQTALTLNDAFHRNGATMVDFAGFVEYLEGVSTDSKDFDLGKIKDFLAKVFPGISEEVQTKTMKNVVAVLHSEVECQGSPFTVSCSTALLHAFWGKVLSAGQELLGLAEEEQAKSESKEPSLLQVESGFAGIFFLTFLVFAYFMIPIMLITAPLWLPGNIALAAFFLILQYVGIIPDNVR